MSDSEDSAPKKKGTKRKPAPEKKKRATGKKARKEKGEPKKPLSAYMFYVQQNRQKVISDNANKLSFGDVGRKLGELWAALPPEEKAHYNELNRKDKERYADQKKEWDLAKGHSEKESKKKAKKKKPPPKKVESEDEDDERGGSDDDGGNDDNNDDDDDDDRSSD
jgi:structure-specific recognition protein 1